MNVSAWKKQTPRLAKFDLFLKIRPGIMGYFANLASTSMNSMVATTPKTSRQMTVTEFHGKDAALVFAHPNLCLPMPS
jgi:hypothetical protein